MNRALVVAALLMFAAPAAAHADNPNNEMLLDLGLHVIGAGYQRYVSPSIAVQVDADFYGPWTQSLANDHGANSTIGAVGRARFFYYLTHAVWVSPFGQAGTARGDVDKKWGLVAAGGASVGYTWWFIDNAMAVAIGVGAQYHYADTRPGFSGVWPHADLNIGYAF